MRRWFLLLLLALAPTSAFAYAEPRLTPDYVRVRAGETAVVDVRIVHLSGLNPTMWGYFFQSSDDAVMFTQGEFQYPRWSGSILVEGRAPGTADIIAGGKKWGRVEVYCNAEAPIEPIDAQHTIRRGEQAQLSVNAVALGRVLQWYAGRLGDRSHPLDGTGPDYTFTSNVLGTHYVWVQATTPCSTSTAEFRIDVARPRARSVRRR